MAEEGPSMGTKRLSSPIVSRRPRAREDPCLFRTRLEEAVHGAEEDDVGFESTDMLDGADLRFDDTQCISVGRSVVRFTTLPSSPTSEVGAAKALGPHLYAAPRSTTSPETAARLELAEPFGDSMDIEDEQNRPVIHKTLSDPTTTYRALLTRYRNNDDENDSEENEEEDNTEAMNLPFWNLPPRHKQHTRHHAGAGDSSSLPDDMSIISDISLIPTYFPSDVQRRPHQHRALVKRLILAKAKAARQTMRQLRRSCRDAVGNVFVESEAHRPPKCVPVGAAC